MQVNPGDLNKRIAIVRKTRKQDENGFWIDSEEVIRQCWASFKRTSGTEAMKSGADFSSVRARFLVRYSKAKILKNDIVKYNNDNYEVEFVNNYNDSNEYIEIWCKLESVK